MLNKKAQKKEGKPEAIQNRPVGQEYLHRQSLQE